LCELFSQNKRDDEGGRGEIPTITNERVVLIISPGVKTEFVVAARILNYWATNSLNKFINQVKKRKRSQQVNISFTPARYIQFAWDYCW